MTWFGILWIVFYGILVVHNLIRIGQGGYTYEWTPGMLWFSIVANTLTLLAILFVGSGSVW